MFKNNLLAQFQKPGPNGSLIITTHPKARKSFAWPPPLFCILLQYHLYEGRTESNQQLFLHANWEQQTKESAVVDGTSCCVILECLVTSIAYIT